MAGVDQIKAGLFAKLERGKGVRFSNALEPSYFEMLVSEKRIVRLVRGRPTCGSSGYRQAAESLDALVYATAAKAGPALSQAASASTPTSWRCRHRRGRRPPKSARRGWIAWAASRGERLGDERPSAKRSFDPKLKASC